MAAEPTPQSAANTSPDRHRRRGSWLWGLVALSLMLIGGGMSILAGSFDRPASARVLGTDAPVNVGAGSPADISAHNSPTVARNPVRPDNLAVSSRIDTPFFSCALHVSSDGGASWSQTAVPAARGEEAKCFAPDVAFSADGTLYLSFVTLRGSGNVPNAVWLSTSKDGGRTLSEPVKVAGRLAFQVRLAADPDRPRRLYITWLQADDVGTLKFTGTGNPIQVMRSDDGGTSWSDPVRVSDQSRERVIAPSPVVGGDGDGDGDGDGGLYLLYLDIEEDRLDYAGAHEGKGGPPYAGTFSLVLARSRDGGSTWEESVVDDSVAPIQRFLVFLPAFPSVAIDRSGRVYAAFHDKRLGDPDVFVWTLDPGSSDWRGPTRVNDNRRGDGSWQYLPKLAVSSDGRLDVLYYDRRLDATNIENNVSLQSSFDAGRSFTPALRLSSGPFDSRIGFGAKEGLPDLGSRLGLVSSAGGALGVWTDTRAGTAETQKQDLAKAVVAIAEPEDLPEAVELGLRYGGLALALAGLVLLTRWLRDRDDERAISGRGRRRQRRRPQS